MKRKYLLALSFFTAIIIVCLHNYANGPYTGCTEKILRHDIHPYAACADAGGEVVEEIPISFGPSDYVALAVFTIGFFSSLGLPVLRGKISSPYTGEKKIDSTTVLLLYTLSLFIPLAGFIVGAIYVLRDEEHYKYVGKNCLICSCLNISLGLAVLFA
jgi:hypothetical protein